MWTTIMSVKSSCSPESKIQTARTGQSESLERCINSFYSYKVADEYEKNKKMGLHFIEQKLHLI